MSNPRKFDAETEKLILQDYEAGIPVEEMVVKYGSGKKPLYGVLDRHGIPRRITKRADIIDRIRVVCPSIAAAMEEKEMEVGDLADKVGYCEAYVRSVLVGTIAMPGVFARYTAQALGTDHAQIKKEADIWRRKNKPDEYRKTKRIYESEMSDEMIAEIVAEYKAGELPVNALAHKWGVGANRIRAFAKRAGVEMRFARRVRSLSDEIKRGILDDYKSGVKLGAICAKYNISENRIYDVVRESGCKMRYRTSAKR